MENIPLFVLLVMGYGPPHWTFPWWLWVATIVLFLLGQPATVLVRFARR